MIDEMLTNVGIVDQNVNAMLLQLSDRANSAQHEQFRGLKHALGYNDFALGKEAVLLAGCIKDSNSLTGPVGRVNDEGFGLDPRQNCDVRLALEEEIASRPLPFVDGVHTVGESNHLAVINIFREWLSHRGPRLGQGIAEWL